MWYREGTSLNQMYLALGEADLGGEQQRVSGYSPLGCASHSFNKTRQGNLQQLDDGEGHDTTLVFISAPFSLSSAALIYPSIGFLLPLSLLLLLLLFLLLLSSSILGYFLSGAILWLGDWWLQLYSAARFGLNPGFVVGIETDWRVSVQLLLNIFLTQLTSQLAFGKW